jgi:hypothetical protein
MRFSFGVLINFKSVLTIENRLGLHVKILKRYPGKVTVAILRTPEQEVNKIALKALAEEIQEKIYIKP